MKQFEWTKGKSISADLEGKSAGDSLPGCICFTGVSNNRFLRELLAAVVMKLLEKVKRWSSCGAVVLAETTKIATSQSQPLVAYYGSLIHL